MSIIQRSGRVGPDKQGSVLCTDLHERKPAWGGSGARPIFGKSALLELGKAMKETPPGTPPGHSPAAGPRLHPGVPCTCTGTAAPGVSWHSRQLTQEE